LLQIENLESKTPAPTSFLLLKEEKTKNLKKV